LLQLDYINVTSINLIKWHILEEQTRNRRSPWDKGMLHNAWSLEKLHVTCMWVSKDVQWSQQW